ncbi:TolC family protein [Simkania sp.]|uniref:TolC family protein n=1 Tax=Simkania sp. TaxID=34094 RepID=UPI003B5215DF
MHHEETFSIETKAELIDLLGAEYKLNLITIEDAWNMEGIRRNVNGALNDPNIDLVITMGVLSSYELLSKSYLPKRAVIGRNINLFSTADRTFSIQESPVVGYYTSPLTVLSEIDTFAKITNADVLAFIGDASLLGDPAFPVIRELIKEKMQEASIIPYFIPVVDEAKPALKALDETTMSGVVFLPTWRMSDEQFQKLINGVNDRYLPSFSLYGELEVQAGVLMTMTPKEEILRAARRIALDAQELLLSGNNQEMVFQFFRAKELIINDRTAKAIGIEFPWNVMREAVYVDRVKPPKYEMLQLSQATTIAVENNLDFLTDYYFVKAGWQDVLRNFSRLMPQIDTRLEGRRIDRNTASAGAGLQPERLIRSTISVSQMLYDERKVADYSIEKKLQRAREYNRDAFELDIILDTAIAYLTILRLKADYKIAEENVALSKANLKRAHELVDSGQARLSEVYRWESEIATNRDALVELEAVIENLKTEFNRLLNRPLHYPVVLEDINPFDTNLTLDYGHLLPHLNTPSRLQDFKEVMTAFAHDQSPTLKQLSSEIAASQRQLTATKRAFYLPEFSLFGEFSNNLYRGGAGTATAPGISGSAMESAVGVVAKYPFFTGGRRNSEKNKAYFEMKRLKTERDATEEKIDEAVIQSVDNMKASYETIFLAKEAADAAEKNLVIVTNSYARGVVSIVDLLDAQNKMIVSKQNYYNSLYDYLINYMEFQRATSLFDFYLDAEQRQEYKIFLIDALKDKK